MWLGYYNLSEKHQRCSELSPRLHAHRKRAGVIYRRLQPARSAAAITPREDPGNSKLLTRTVAPSVRALQRGRNGRQGRLRFSHGLLRLRAWVCLQDNCFDMRSCHYSPVANRQEAERACLVWFHWESFLSRGRCCSSVQTNGLWALQITFSSWKYKILCVTCVIREIICDFKSSSQPLFWKLHSLSYFIATHIR